jgi:V/A-type H+-transporting ATPase subunit F
MRNRIGVIGDRDSVLGFKAVGLDVFACADTEEARKTLSGIAKHDYAIIFLTEGFAKDMQDLTSYYKDHKLPAIIPIPGADGNFGVGFGNLKESVERAVGADILFGGDH